MSQRNHAAGGDGALSEDVSGDAESHVLQHGRKSTTFVLNVDDGKDFSSQVDATTDGVPVNDHGRPSLGYLTIIHEEDESASDDSEDESSDNHGRWKERRGSAYQFRRGLSGRTTRLIKRFKEISTQSTTLNTRSFTVSARSRSVFEHRQAKHSSRTITTVVLGAVQSDLCYLFGNVIWIISSILFFLSVLEVVAIGFVIGALTRTLGSTADLWAEAGAWSKERTVSKGPKRDPLALVSVIAGFLTNLCFTVGFTFFWPGWDTLIYLVYSNRLGSIFSLLVSTLGVIRLRLGRIKGKDLPLILAFNFAASSLFIFGGAMYEAKDGNVPKFFSAGVTLTGASLLTISSFLLSSLKRAPTASVQPELRQKDGPHWAALAAKAKKDFEANTVDIANLDDDGSRRPSVTIIDTRQSDSVQQGLDLPKDSAPSNSTRWTVLL